MQRRTLLKGILIFSLGGTTLYSCQDKYEAIKALNLEHIPVNKQELDILSDLLQRILPFQKIEAFKNQTALPFTLKMVNDCYTQKDRTRFISGYQNFSSYINENYPISYSNLSQDEHQTLLDNLNTSEKPYSDIEFLFHTLKKEAVNYIVHSEYIQQQIRYYELAPGRFKGCIPIADLKNKNQITHG